MTAIAPLSVLLIGLLAFLVIGFGLVRMVIAERAIVRPVAVHRPTQTAQRPLNRAA